MIKKILFLFLCMNILFSIHIISQTPDPANTQVTQTLQPGTKTQVLPPIDIIELIKFFTWPAITLILFIIFRNPLLNLLDAITKNIHRAKLKAFGFEFEFPQINNTDDFVNYSKSKGNIPKITGDPDKFELLCKASNSNLSKSTKILNLQNGFIIQVSTREVIKEHSVAVAEALTFVPGLNVNIKKIKQNKPREKYEKIEAYFEPIKNSK